VTLLMREKVVLQVHAGLVLGIDVQGNVGEHLPQPLGMTRLATL
jgi:hypothetical protein